MFHGLLKLLKEAVPAFDVSDTPGPEAQVPKVKKPPPTPMAALKRGMKRIKSMPDRDLGDSRQTFAPIIAEARRFVEGGGSRATKAARQALDWEMRSTDSAGARVQKLPKAAKALKISNEKFVLPHGDEKRDFRAQLKMPERNLQKLKRPHIP